MATTLYLHSDLSAVGGTLPATEQSDETTVNETVSFPEGGPGYDGSATHRKMDESQGSSENDVWFHVTELTFPNVVSYDTRYRAMGAQFVSEELSAGSIAAATWTLYMDATGGNDIGFAANISPSIYLWRPSTGAKITDIYNEADVTSNGVSVANNLATRAEYSKAVSGAGATAQAGDVIVVEVWVYAISAGLGASELYIFYDTGTDGRIVAPDLPFDEPPPPTTIPQVGVFDPHLNPQAWF